MCNALDDIDTLGSFAEHRGGIFKAIDILRTISNGARAEIDSTRLAWWERRGSVRRPFKAEDPQVVDVRSRLFLSCLLQIAVR